MISYRRGDVVLVPFDFTDRSGTKWRPAVIISNDRYNQHSPDVLIASITGNLRALPHLGDTRIRDWRGTGLIKPSLAQMKIATIESRLLGRVLGQLSDVDLAEFEDGLRNTLDL